jgi:uncharacterized SAM-binding protein YcdF (DUF218 family)
MFFYLSKAFSMFLQPLGWVFIVWIVLFFIKNKSTKNILIGSQIFILWVFSMGAFTEWASKAYEVHPTDLKNIRPTEMGIVLTGGLANDPESIRNGSYIGHASDRMWQAARLFKAKKIRKILISGGDNSKNLIKIENEVARKFLLDFGVPDTCIIQELKSLNTFENALYSREILDTLFERDSVILITSAYHMPRAVACFKKQKIHVVPFSADPICTFWKVNFKDFLPDSEELYKSKLLVKEWIGMVTYKIMGYI